MVVAVLLILAGSGPRADHLHDAGNYGVAELAKKWAITEEQAACARTGAWKSCVQKWPEVLVLWRGYLETRAPLGDLLDTMPVDVATQLVRGNGLENQRIARHLVRRAPERLMALLDDPFVKDQIAAAAIELRAPRTDAEWRRTAQVRLTELLHVHELVAAARTWQQLAEPVRSEMFTTYLGGEVTTSAEQPKGSPHVLLALGLVLLGDRENAQKVPIFAGTDEVLVDTLRWHLTRQRTVDAWAAAIHSVKHRQCSGDLCAALLPYLAPFHTVHRATVERGNTITPTLRDVATRMQLIDAVQFDWSWPATQFSVRQTAWNGPPPRRVVPQKPLRKNGWSIREYETSREWWCVHPEDWLLASRDQGRSWKAIPLPPLEWVTRRPSNVPLISDDGLVRIEADAFAEGGVIVLRHDVVLEAPIEVLLRDSDGDGLSDTYEAAVFLNPFSVDSDGDGLLDPYDPSRTDDRVAPSPATSALTNRLKRAPSGACVVLDLEAFGGLKVPKETFVVTPAEYETRRARWPHCGKAAVVTNGPDHAIFDFQTPASAQTDRIDRADDGGMTVTNIQGWVE